MTRVGLFGGSFNPPHVGHLIVAEQLREQFALDAIWWMPAAQPPHKDGDDLAAAHHRLAMTRLATEGHPAFVVSDLELQREGPSYTVDTLAELQEAHPDHAFHLLIGGDSLRGFGTWHRPEAIAECVPLRVYRRPGDEMTEADVDPRWRDRVRFAEAPLIEISASDVRARRAAGRSIRYLVPDAVRAYIEQHGLYAG